MPEPKNTNGAQRLAQDKPLARPMTRGEKRVTAALLYAQDQAKNALSSFVGPAGVAGLYAGNAVAQQVERYKKAYEMGVETGKKFPGEDDLNDAIRHAEWSRRMASEIGPFTSWSMGVGQEIRGLSQRALDKKMRDDILRWPAVKMDLYNNAMGRKAAREGRPINTEELRHSPEDNRPSARTRY